MDYGHTRYLQYVLIRLINSDINYSYNIVPTVYYTVFKRRSTEFWSMHLCIRYVYNIIRYHIIILYELIFNWISNHVSILACWLRLWKGSELDFHPKIRIFVLYKTILIAMVGVVYYYIIVKKKIRSVGNESTSLVR